MSLKNATLSLAAIAALGSACVGDVSISKDPPPVEDPGDDPDDPTPTANEQALFESSVEPILAAKCTGAACHDNQQYPAFLAGGEAYDQVLSFGELHGNFETGQALLLTYIVPGTHAPLGEPIVYTADEQLAIETWILAEKAIRGDNTDVEVVATDKQAMGQFSGCMTLDNWEQSNMGDWTDKGSNNGPCGTCHSNGLKRFLANDDSEEMFLKNQYELFFIGFFTTARDPLVNGGAPMVIPAHEKLDRMGDGGAPGQLHPLYNYGPNDEYYLYLEDFYNRTVLNMEQNPACMDIGFPAVP